jgi:hypothetical protein
VNLKNIWPDLQKSEDGLMTAAWYGGAPTSLAVLDEGLICRRASRGWRERLGVADAGDELDIPLSVIIVLESAAGLADQLRAVLRQAKPLQDMRVSLRE